MSFFNRLLSFYVHDVFCYETISLVQISVVMILLHIYVIVVEYTYVYFMERIFI